MVSVLIPIYNYDVSDLVNEVHKQLINSRIPFEIFCLEDGSDEDFVNQNSRIKNLSDTTMLISESNHGRIKSRQILCEHAKYNWLLFLDADVMPISSVFISNYIYLIDSKYEAVFGGISYHKKKPEKSHILRWKYGILHEEVNAEKRKINKYKHIVSANMLIKKELFKLTNSKIEYDGYGLDNYFAALLMEQKIDIQHINNEVYHLGIEKSEVYLKKKECAVINLLKLYEEHKIISNENNLFSLFAFLKSLKLHYIFSVFYKIFKSPMKNNLLGNHPSIALLQFYRITFMCNTYLESKL